MTSKLPPIEFDGEKFSTELKNKRCEHKNVVLNGNKIFCKDCGAEWAGPNIKALWEAFNERKK